MGDEKVQRKQLPFDRISLHGERKRWMDIPKKI